MIPGGGRGSLQVVVLAAGRSRRFGARDKLTSLVNGRPMALHVARLVAGLACGAAVAVVRNPAVAGLFRSHGFAVVPAARQDGGQSASLKHGLASVRRRGASRVLVLLADMPFLTRADLERMVRRRAWQPAMAQAGGLAMPPALVPRLLFPLLDRLKGDTGAGAILRRRPDLRRVNLATSSLIDIDKPGAPHC